MAITLISTVTVGSGGAASIDFTSIPGTYTDLMCVVSGRAAGTSSGNTMQMNINGSQTGQSFRLLYGQSTAGVVGSGSGSGSSAGFFNGSSESANTFASISTYLPNYAGSTAKSWSNDSVMESNNGSGVYLGLTAGLSTGTGAITSLGFVMSGTTFVQYSSASLYGVLKGSSGGVSVS